MWMALMELLWGDAGGYTEQWTSNYIVTGNPQKCDVGIQSIKDASKAG
jgi:hypothetical protein